MELLKKPASCVLVGQRSQRTPVRFTPFPACGLAGRDFLNSSRHLTMKQPEVYSHFIKLPYYSEEITFVLLNDINGELLTCAIDAGVRPDSRATFVPAKVAKTIDALPGHIRLGGRKPREGGPTRCAHTRPAEG
jgi:hypothetical protein